MNLKKNPKPGQCAIMRCPDRADDLLCDKHLAQWRAEGEPALEQAKAKPPVGSGLVPVHVKAELDTERGRAQQALQMIQVLPIESQADLDLAADMYNMARAKVKALEEQRKSVTDPINAAVKEINGWFRPVREFYESCGKAIESRMRTKLAELQLAQDTALQEIQEKKTDASPEAFALAHQPAQAPAQVSQVETLEYTVVDFKRLPDEYKLANDAKIRQALREQGMDCNIPGIRIEAVMRFRAGR